MGRTEKSQGLAPPAIRKDIRAKQAKQVINRTIPALLNSISRAKKGVESSELIVYPVPVSSVALGKQDGERQEEDAAYVKRKGQGRRKIKGERDMQDDSEHPRSRKQKKSIDLKDDLANLSLNPQPKPLNSSPSTRKIRIITTDTLTAAHMLTFPTHYDPSSSKPPKKSPNICILNMASPLRPGGGVLTGATSQEEFLCARTTLLPSLVESYYRLPELGGIWSPDILVFHNAGPLGDAKGELGPGERYWIDAVSAGMLRFPELEGGEDELKRLGKKDRSFVEAKMQAVLRIMQKKGVKKVVLGAWGCGAYGNPVIDVAQAWRKVLGGAATGSKSGKKEKSEVETWPNLEEVVFAISNRRMAKDFAQAFDKKIEVEAGPDDNEDDEEDEEEDEVAEELKTKINEMEGQLSAVWNPDLKARMGVILEGLKAQLAEREETGDHGGVSLEDDASSGIGGADLTPQDSDNEEEEDDEYDDDESEEEKGEELAVKQQKETK
ncbi:hypothetical protein DE146DRAFT_668018 [Phaeosphaeria sp. MPI-PUGE-AT-0046c]|nr:hypothetical protein DE146DRAFT_668018 [Phaeosphaeria sp. MPI-PUGE-AT-0046c]